MKFISSVCVLHVDAVLDGGEIVCSSVDEFSILRCNALRLTTNGNQKCG